jgi:hypothetical protein
MCKRVTLTVVALRFMARLLPLKIAPLQPPPLRPPRPKLVQEPVTPAHTALAPAVIRLTLPGKVAEACI